MAVEEADLFLAPLGVKGMTWGNSGAVGICWGKRGESLGVDCKLASDYPFYPNITIIIGELLVMMNI